MQGAIRRKLTDEEMAVYRAPFPTPSHAGRPGVSRATADRRRAGRRLRDDGAAHAALAGSTYPKLLFAAEPGGRAAGVRGGARRQAQGLPIRQAGGRHSFSAGGSSRDDRMIRRRLHR